MGKVKQAAMVFAGAALAFGGLQAHKWYATLPSGPSYHRVVVGTAILKCENLQVDRCGVNLSKCESGRNYYCFQGVTTLDDDAKEPTPSPTPAPAQPATKPAAPTP